jgi:D-alanyl-D-alanine-carboxypeptidase/D-alanyl-D-alanine-endopeptidase
MNTLAAVVLVLPLACSQEPSAQSLVDSGQAVGLVVGTFKDGNATTRGYGLVSKDSDAVPAGDTVYEIGSITKTFVGILLADAVERELVALDDPVVEYLPTGVTAPAKNGTEIRLVHLSTHTSGLPRIAMNRPVDVKNPFASYDVVQLYEVLGEVSLLSVPGERYSYSNLAAGLLGHTLALVNDSAFEETLRVRILAPLGLADTTITLTDDLRARLAPPYTSQGEPRQNWDFDVLAGCGAIRSTANDMLIYARANLDPDSAAGLTEAIRASHVVRHAFGSGGGVGLGWHVEAGGVVWHNGGTGGYSAYLGLHPESQTAVVVLANTTSREVDAVGRSVLARLRKD